MSTTMEKISRPEQLSPESPARGIEYRDYWLEIHGRRDLTHLLRVGRVYLATDSGLEMMLSNAVDAELGGGSMTAEVYISFPDGFQRAPLSPEHPRKALIPYSHADVTPGEKAPTFTILDENDDRVGRLFAGVVIRVELQERQWRDDDPRPPLMMVGY